MKKMRWIRIEILDAHHHFFDFRNHDKGLPFPRWVLKLTYLQYDVDSMANLEKQDPKLIHSFGSRLPLLTPYMGEELMKDIEGNGRGHKVVGTIYMECGWKTPGVEECMEPVGEAAMVSEVHAKYPLLCKGMVCFADLRLGKAAEPALIHYKKNPLVKGIRHGLAYTGHPLMADAAHCDANTASDPKFREGFGLLAKYGFVFDSWLFHPQIAPLTDLAEAFPDTTIVCDHMGYPLGLIDYKSEEVFPEWKRLMARLAKCPNVMVKIGGFGMRWPNFGFDERPKPASSDEIAAAWKPYVLHCLEVFGVDRCIMESNFPMDKISCNYTVCFNALKKCVRGYSLEDRRKLFEGNARRIYKL